MDKCGIRDAVVCRVWELVATRKLIIKRWDLGEAGVSLRR